jgi:uncharacterized protein YndB with AHSA1/START domain
VQVETIAIGRPVEDCWRAFIDPTVMTRWVPGLVDVRLIETTTDGLPLEIQFEFAGGHIYSLVYTYDREGREVRWEPRPGEHGAVRGYARFAATAGGAELTYALEHDRDRRAAERMLDAPKLLLAAFARWMEES